MLYAQSVFANPTVKLNLSVKMKAETMYSYMKRPRLKCGRLISSTNGPFIKGPFYPEVSLNSEFDHDQTFENKIGLDINTGSTIENKKNKYFRIIRKVIGDIKINNPNINSDEININLNEEIPYDQSGGLDSISGKTSCKFKRWNMAYSSPTIEGEIEVIYKVPNDVWILRVNRSVTEGLFQLTNIESIDHRGFKNSLNPFMDDSLPNEDVYVWVTPGSVISQKYIFTDSKKNTQLPFNGSLNIKIYKYISNNSVFGEDEAFDFILNDLKNMSLLVSNEKEAIDFSLKLANIFNNKDILIHLINKLSIFDLEVLFGWLSVLRDYPRLDNYQGHVRIAATILAFELSKTYLNNFGPFCKKASVIFPYKDQKINVSWLSLTNYYVLKSMDRIENYNVDSIAEFINILSKFEQDGYTYSDIRNNPIKFDKVQKAFEILKLAVDFRQSKMKLSLVEMETVFQNEESPASKIESSHLLLKSLRDLSVVEMGVIQSLVDKMRDFQSDNQNKVEVDSLKESLGGFRYKISEFIDLMDSNSMLYTTSASGLKKMHELIIDLSINNILVFNKKMENDFEFFRKAFFDQEYMNRTENLVFECMDIEKI
jgi:hypothetical protein